MTDTPILQPGRNCRDLAKIDESGLLIDARDYYKAFYEAAEAARRYILLAGWQFDSQVTLLRAKDTRGHRQETRLLPFLSQLCTDAGDLQVFVLSWDYSALFALEREWFQDMLFSNWGQNDRIHFQFDSSHALGASHHRKVVVIDGVVAFVGGMDLCEGRWDDRRHLSRNPHRIGPTGRPHEPVHDVQCYVRGDAAWTLAGLFCDWWFESGGGVLRLPEPDKDRRIPVSPTLPLAGRHVAISRTETRSIVPAREPIMEIRQLYRDAIRAAEDLIYLENQYFSSRAIYDALFERLRDTGRNRLEIVIVLPGVPHGFLEKVSIIRTQAWMLHSLMATSDRNGHRLGIYSLFAAGYKARTDQTYVHSKLMIVDDRFLMVGSANANNRGMGLDTELNLSWEALPGDEDMIASIRDARVNLLAEHTGARRRKRRHLHRIEGLVALLDEVAGKRGSRLHLRMPEKTPGPDGSIPKDDAWPLDPERPPVEETLYETLIENPDGILASGLSMMNGLVAPSSSAQSKAAQGRSGMLFRKGSLVKAITLRRVLVGLLAAAAVAAILYLVT